MRFLAVIALIVVASFSLACDGPQLMSASSTGAKTAGYSSGYGSSNAGLPELPPVFKRDTQKQLEDPSDDTPEEAKFKKTGPKLYDMNTANALSKRTGKPVLCWMGKHVFSDPKAREASLRLADVAIMAVMDVDGETHDAKGRTLPIHRVKFTDNGFYSKESSVAFIPVSKLDSKSDAKILAFTRGGQ